MRATEAPRPTHYRAAVIVARDVIELDGQPWRVVSGRTTAVVRTLVCEHAHYPNRTRVVRLRHDARVRMLHPYVPGAALTMPVQTHLTEAELRALGERLARYGRRRQAAERGADWTTVR